MGICCICVGLAHASLAATLCLLITFSFFVQGTEGATFAVVPFVSKRALGAVSGIVGAGGDFGSVLTQVSQSASVLASLLALTAKYSMKFARGLVNIAIVMEPWRRFLQYCGSAHACTAQHLASRPTCEYASAHTSQQHPPVLQLVWRSVRMASTRSLHVQVIFFRFSTRPTHLSITYMGIMILAMSVATLPIYFPAWGGLLKGPKEGATEEEYYLADYNDAEIAAVRLDPALAWDQCF
jgi:hypothetical protein